MRGSSLLLVEKVADRLGPELREEVAFLGGATIELLLTDPAVAEVRVTKDVDLITAARSRVSFLVGFADRLRALGFQEGGEGARRWKVADVIVDVMPVEEEAFHGSGEGDYLMSHDVGDIIALVDGRQELVEEVRADSRALQEYLTIQLTPWLAEDRFTFLAVPGHLPYDAERTGIVLERLRAIAGVVNPPVG